MRAQTQANWQPFAARLAGETIQVPISSGTVLCVRIRQTSFQVTSPWSRQACAIRPLEAYKLRRAFGRISRVSDGHYPTSRATIMRGKTRLVVGRVPVGARFGAIWTSPPEGSPIGCGWPRFHMNRRGTGSGMAGRVDGRVMWLASDKTSRGARFSLFTPAYQRTTCRIGGAIVIPTWIP